MERATAKADAGSSRRFTSTRKLRGGPFGLLLKAVGLMTVEPLPISGALLVTPKVYSDVRGSFAEIFASTRYADAGIADVFIQDNLSVSRRGVLRGLHGDRRMSKLVQVLEGEAFDVIADAREDSPTYGRWYGTLLKASERRQIYIPKGCLHGFLALSESVAFLYKQSALYDPSSEFGVAWDDPDLAVQWPLAGRPPILSEKDAVNPTLANLVARRA
jgi:dTDP-4-dehydrorhamnose 3,5-epimerase